MKEGKSKLVLNKKTIAHLNNLEMRHVRGGDGGETDVSNAYCTEKDKKPLPDAKPIEEIPTIIKTLTMTIQTRILC